MTLLMGLNALRFDLENLPTLKVPALPASKRVLFLGSSSEADRGASSVDDGLWMQDARDRGYMKVAAQYLRDTLDLPVKIDGNFGNQANTAPGLAGYTSYDPTVIVDSTGVTFSSVPSLGGNGFLLAASNPGKGLSKTFAAGTETIEFWATLAASATSPQDNRLQYSVDGGPLIAHRFTDTNIAKITISALSRDVPRTLRIQTHATIGNPNTINILGWNAYNSTTKEVVCMFAGARGWNTSAANWTAATAGANPMAMLSSVNPNVVIEAFGGNEDFTTDGSLVAFISRCATFHDAVSAVGAKAGMLIKPFRYAGAKGPGDFYSEYETRDARIALAKARGIPFFDLSEAAGPLSLAIANKEVRPDKTHYGPSWHDRVGAKVGKWIFTSGLLFDE